MGQLTTRDESGLMAALVKISLLQLDRRHEGGGNTYYNLAEAMRSIATKAIGVFRAGPAPESPKTDAEREAFFTDIGRP